MDESFTPVLGLPLHEHPITLSRVAQDGTRVRASAGSASFRRKARLRACLGVARDHLARLNVAAERVGARATWQDGA